jgi:hypothetical protein
MEYDQRKQAADPVLERLRLNIREKMDDTANVILQSGVIKNFPEYTNKVGVIEGFAIAERELLDLDITLSKANEG